MPLWRGGPNTRTLPTVLLTPSASKAADMAHLCVPQNQALGVCRGFAPDIQICGTHGRKNLVSAAIISNAEEEEDNQHAPSMKTECDYLNGWIKKRSHTQKSHPKLVNPRDIAGERRRRRRSLVLLVSEDSNSFLFCRQKH